MNAPIPEPWLDAMKKVGITSYRQLSTAANLSVETVRAVVLGIRTSVQPETILGMSAALRVPTTTITQWLGVKAQGVVEYQPPREASLMTRRQREAVDEMIRLLTATNTTSSSVPVEEPEPATASAAVPTTPVEVDYSDPIAYAEEAQARYQRVMRSGLAPAARHHEPDPYEGLGEENQDNN